MNTIDYAAFSSVWYWLCFLGIWSLSAHRYLGIPYYYWVLAQRGDSYMQTYLTELTPINARLHLDHARIKSPVSVTLLLSFLLSLWAGAGFMFDNELLQATFVLFVPLLLLIPLRLWLAQGICAGPAEFDHLFRLMRRTRYMTFGLAAVVIFTATLWGLFYNYSHAGIFG